MASEILTMFRAKWVTRKSIACSRRNLLTRLSGRALVKPVVLLFVLLPALCGAEVFNGTPANYLTLLAKLQAGDRLQLEPGTYENGLPVYYLNGSADVPIVIAGPNEGARAVFLGSNSNNTVRIRESSYVEIYNLELDGRGRIGDAVNADGRGDWAHHITIENFLIYGHGADKSVAAIATHGCTTWDWVIRNNVIIGAGTGMYLGNSPGNNPFIAGLVENNLILDTLGYNIQVKQQNSRPVLPGIPVGPRNTIIRHNVFSKANNGVGGGSARPNLLVGHFPLVGAGANDQYLVYGNFFYQNPTEALFQGEGNIALYNNLFVNDFGDAVHIQAHNDVPRMIRVFNNTIVATGNGIRVSNGDSAYQQKVIGNAVFAGTPINALDQQDNVVAAYASAADYLTKPYADPGELDLFPQLGMLSGRALDITPINSFVDWNIDFNGKQHDGTFRGAYSEDGQNQAWLPKLERKKVANVNIAIPSAPTGLNIKLPSI